MNPFTAGVTIDADNDTNAQASDQSVSDLSESLSDIDDDEVCGLLSVLTYFRLSLQEHSEIFLQGNNSVENGFSVHCKTLQHNLCS